MSGYFILILSTFITSILENLKNINKKFLKFFQKICIVLFFILISFNRDNSDYNAYVNIFNRGFNDGVREKGYLFFTESIKYFGGSYNIVPFTMGIFMIYVLFKKYKVKDKATLILIYALHNLIFDIIQIRNTFCVLFILSGIYLLQKNKNIGYLIYNLLAISFHKIGIIYLLFYILNKIKLKKYIILIVLNNIISLFISNIYTFLIIKFFPTKVAYLKIEFNRGVLIFYLLTLIDIILTVYIEKNRKKDKQREIYLKFILFPILFLPIGIFTSELIQRLWRNAFLLKIIYCLRFSKSRKKVVIIILIFQQILYLSYRLWRGPEFILTLLKQFSNIKFYF